VESATSLTDDESVGRFGAASGDEDAGMLEDETIAELSADTVRPEDLASSKKAEDDAQRARQAIDDATAAVKQKKELERQAVEAQVAIQQQAARTKEEEARLANEEEAAIAKARRKAERKAIKEGLLQIRSEAQGSQRRKLTEAEAEAAAGGFDFAEEMPSQEPFDEFVQHQSPSQMPYDQDFEAHQEVVHHHHYYHEPVQHDDVQHYVEPPSFNVSMSGEYRDAVDTEKTEEDEEDADIAGLGFSKNRRKREDRGGSYGSRSNGSGGSGSRHSGSAHNGRRYERSTAHSGSSSGARRESANHLTAESANGSGKQSYRERPRRHERTKSQSTGSGAGRTPREGPGARIITSPTIPEADSMQNVQQTQDSFSDDRADAAAGGFDDFVVAAATTLPPSYSPASSLSARSNDRRREGPRTQKAGLNAPRNPQGANVFTNRSHDDQVDGL
jgi:hypothetical protein